MKSLLKEYIQLALEATRSSQPGFDIRNLKTMKDPVEIYNYVKKFLQPMGRGSSRATFLIGSRKILKLAKNPAGIAQNEAELDVFTNPVTKNVTAKIYDYDPQGKWLVSELVRPISELDFENLMHWGWDEFVEALTKAVKNQPLDRDEVPKEHQRFFKNALAMIKSGNLELGDLRVADHWGKTGDNRLVLLDYGFTTGVMQQHYAGDYPANFPGISKTKHAPVKDSEDVDWGDVFMSSTLKK